jgi:hypothetical protein
MAYGKKTGGRDFVKKVPSSKSSGARLRIAAETKAMRKLTRADLVLMGSMLTSMPLREARLVAKNESNTTLRTVCANAIVRANDEGDFALFDRLLDRVIGKVKEEVDVRVGLHTLSDEELQARLEKLRAKSRG